MNNLNQISNLMNKTYSAKDEDFIDISARENNLILIPIESFKNYNTIHNNADERGYITIPYEYASIVGYSYQGVYDMIEGMIMPCINNLYPNCNKNLIESFIENEVIRLVDYVYDRGISNEYLYNAFVVTESITRFEEYIKRANKPIAVSYIEVSGGFIRQHEVHIFDTYEKALENFQGKVNNLKQNDWYKTANLEGGDIFLTDKKHEFAFEDTTDAYGSHYIRLDF